MHRSEGLAEVAEVAKEVPQETDEAAAAEGEVHASFLQTQQTQLGAALAAPEEEDEGACFSAGDSKAARWLQQAEDWVCWQKDSELATDAALARAQLAAQEAARAVLNQAAAQLAQAAAHAGYNAALNAAQTAAAGALDAQQAKSAAEAAAKAAVATATKAAAAAARKGALAVGAAAMESARSVAADAAQDAAAEAVANAKAAIQQRADACEEGGVLDLLHEPGDILRPQESLAAGPRRCTAHSDCAGEHPLWQWSVSGRGDAAHVDDGYCDWSGKCAGLADCCFYRDSIDGECPQLCRKEHPTLLPVLQGLRDAAAQGDKVNRKGFELGPIPNAEDRRTLPYAGPQVAGRDGGCVEGAKVVARWEPYEDSDDSPWFAATVVLRHADGKSFIIQYEDGDFADDVPAHLVRLCPGRHVSWGRLPWRGNDVIPRGCGECASCAHQTAPRELVDSAIEPMRVRPGPLRSLAPCYDCDGALRAHQCSAAAKYSYLQQPPFRAVPDVDAFDGAFGRVIPGKPSLGSSADLSLEQCAARCRGMDGYSGDPLCVSFGFLGGEGKREGSGSHCEWWSTTIVLPLPEGSPVTPQDPSLPLVSGVAVDGVRVEPNPLSRRGWWWYSRKQMPAPLPEEAPVEVGETGSTGGATAGETGMAAWEKALVSQAVVMAGPRTDSTVGKLIGVLDADGTPAATGPTGAAVVVPQVAAIDMVVRLTIPEGQQQLEASGSSGASGASGGATGAEWERSPLPRRVADEVAEEAAQEAAALQEVESEIERDEERLHDAEVAQSFATGAAGTAAAQRKHDKAMAELEATQAEEQVLDEERLEARDRLLDHAREALAAAEVELDRAVTPEEEQQAEQDLTQARQLKLAVEARDRALRSAQKAAEVAADDEAVAAAAELPEVAELPKDDAAAAAAAKKTEREADKTSVEASGKAKTAAAAAAAAAVEGVAEGGSTTRFAARAQRAADSDEEQESPKTRPHAQVAATGQGLEGGWPKPEDEQAQAETTKAITDSMPSLDSKPAKRKPKPTVKSAAAGLPCTSLTALCFALLLASRR